MTKFLTVLLLVCLGSDSLVFGGKTSHTQTETITVKEKKSIRVLYGVVRDSNDVPIEGVYVEVLANGKAVVKGKSASDIEQRVVASAKTNAFGKFRFKNLPAGKYEARFTAVGFNELLFYVEVKPNSRNLKGVKINLPVAT